MKRRNRWADALARRAREASSAAISSGVRSGASVGSAPPGVFCVSVIGTPLYVDINPMQSLEAASALMAFYWLIRTLSLADLTPNPSPPRRGEPEIWRLPSRWSPDPSPLRGGWPIGRERFAPALTQSTQETPCMAENIQRHRSFSGESAP